MICTYVTEPAMSTAEGIFTVVFVGVFLFIYLAMFGLMITGYVFQSLGMYRIAQRRGIHRPWLAWIPVANSWLLGSISDQYQYVTRQKVTKRRLTILILEIAMIVIYVGMLVSMFAMMFSMDASATAMDGFGIVLVMLGGMFLLLGVAIAALVFAYLACFDLFRSCRPQNEVIFLVLSIVIPITLPFFIFACSNYDLGMPPRQVPPEPAQIPCSVEDPAQEETSGEN